MSNGKRKILYIDPILQEGHVGFNRIFINSLKQENTVISYVFSKNYYQKLNIPFESLVFEIPAFFFKYNLKGFGNRVLYFLVLIFLRMRINFSKYDLVVFSSFEEISFFFSGIHSTHIINHINVSNSKSKIKFFFLKRAIAKNTCIVFDESIKEYLNNKGVSNIIVKPHGLRKPFSKKSIDLKIFNTNLYFKQRNPSFIFIPSSNSTDVNYLESIVSNKSFIEFLSLKNIFLVLKNKINFQSEKIVVLPENLNDNTYASFFIKAKLILICYDSTFTYRTSGVLFECFSNNKPCLIRKNDIFKSYEQYFCYNPYFETVENLLSGISQILNSQTQRIYKDLNSLTPNLIDL